MKPPCDDVDRIMDIMSSAFDPAYGEAWTRRQVEDAMSLSNCRHLLVNKHCQPAAEGEEAVGFSLTRTCLDEEEILLLAVSPAYRLKGIAIYMLERLEKTARQRGIRRLVLEMRHDNPAEALYRKAGFVPVGRRPEYYGRSDGRRADAITFARSVE